MIERFPTMFAAIVLLGSAMASAEPLRVEAVMTPEEQMRLDFEDGSQRFVLLVRRRGRAAGDGLFAGAEVVEYGMHDIEPGVGGDPRGYLVFRDAAGDRAYVRWRVRAVFVRDPGGKRRLLDNGYWEVVGGTGRFAGLEGAGTLHIRPAGPVARRFVLEGELVPAP